MHQIWTKQTDIADYTEHSQLGAMVQLQLERAAATDAAPWPSESMTSTDGCRP